MAVAPNDRSTTPRMFWSIDCCAADANDEGLTGQLKSLVVEKGRLDTPSHSQRWVEAFEFDACISGGEVPVG